MKFEAEGREFAKRIRSLTRTIFSNSERSVQFLKQNAFLTSSWSFLRSNMLEKLEFKLEKLIGSRNLQEKLEKDLSLNYLD